MAQCGAAGDGAGSIRIAGARRKRLQRSGSGGGSVWGSEGLRHRVLCGDRDGDWVGIILDGKFYHGKNGAAAEGGHVSIDYRSGTVCRCGSRGCIEALASGHVLDRGAYDLDDLAVQLGAWLGSVVSLLDPDIIVIGGGVARIGEPLFEKLRAIVPGRTVNPHAAELPIVPAKFGADAVWWGRRR